MRWTSPSPLRLVAEIVLVVGTAVAAVLILMAALGARAIVEGRYDRALRFNPHSSDAATEMAGGALDDRQLSEATGYSRMALANSPLNADAIAIWALAERQKGRAAEAERLMSVGAQLGWVNVDTQLWALDKALKREDAAAAVFRSSAVLQQGLATDEMFAVLRYASRSQEGLETLAKRLAQRPKWRRDYMIRLKAIEPADYPTHEALLNRLATTEAPPTREEMRAFSVELACGGDRRCIAARSRRPTRPALFAFPPA